MSTLYCRGSVLHKYLLCVQMSIQCVEYAFTVIYTSQQRKRCKGLMLNMVFFTKAIKIVYFRFIWAKKNKALLIKFHNINIRGNHGKTEIVMQYGGSITCVTICCSNDIFAYQTHRTNQSLDKGLCDVVLLVHKCVTQLL